MNKTVARLTPPLAAALFCSACASNPKNIGTAYVSPVKYGDLSCEQLAVERTAVEYRANVLYRSLQKRANSDALLMGVGVAVFVPTLFFLKGNSAKAAEFAHLKGDYQAIRLNADAKGCALEFRDLERRGAKHPVTAEMAVDLVPEPATK